MDLYDPFGFWQDPYQQQQAPAPQQVPGQRAVPLLAPAEEDSLLARITGNVLGGVGYVGQTLDKWTGGRAVRGLLGGRPEELLSLLPGSDSLFHVTDPSNAVSGHDLLKQWGAVDSNDDSWTGTLGGMGLEMALSPATYLLGPGAALTNSGQAAKAAGTLESTLAGRIAAGQGGLAGLHVPFTEGAAVLGTGPTAQAFAGKLGQAADYLSYGNPYGRAVGGLFDANREGATTEALQRAAVAANKARPAAEAAARQKVYGWGQTLQDANLLGESDALRGMLEGTVSALPNTDAGRTLGGVAGEMRTYLDEVLGQERGQGIPASNLVDDAVQYAPRQRVGLAKETAGFSTRGSQPVNPWNANLEGREDFLRNVPGGTNQINQWFRPDFFQDAKGQPLSELESATLLRKELGVDDSRLAALQQLRDQGVIDPSQRKELWERSVGPKKVPLTPVEAEHLARIDELAKLEGQWKQANSLRKWITDQDPQFAQQGIDYFGNHILDDVLQRGVRSARSTSRAGAIHEALASAATDAASAGPGSRSLLDVLKDAGLGEGAGAAGPAGLPTGGFDSQLEALAKASKVNLGKMNGAQMMQKLADLHVPAEVAKDMTRYVQGFSRPEVLDPFLKGLDSITMLTKAGNTAIWPAKYARDFAQSAWMNFVKDARDPGFSLLDPRTWTKPYEYAKTVFRDGGTLPAEVTQRIPHMAGLSAEEATQRLAQEAASYRIFEGTRARDTGLAGDQAGSKTFNLPGAKKESLGEFVKGFKPDRTATESVFGIDTPSSTLPWNVGGVGNSNETQFFLAKQGGKAMEWIDDMNRGAAYLSKRLQGYAPEAAARAVFEAHFDYSALSPFERSVMKRVVPFYSWMRGNVPTQVNELLQKPGGAVAQAMRVTDDLRQKAGFVPDYIGDGLAIPTGKEEDGTQRFLSNLGLGHEDAFGDLSVGPKGGQRTLENLLARTNPLIKGVLEYATGKQFYSGRDLEDLSSKGLTGNTAIDQALTNSPISRLLTTERTLLDDRKGLGAKALNLTSPLKVTDVDVDKARSVAGREALEDLLRQNPAVKQFETLSVPDALLPNLSPEEFRALQLFKTLEAAHKKKPAQIGVRPAS